MSERHRSNLDSDPTADTIDKLINRQDRIWVNLPALAKNLIYQVVDYHYSPVESYHQSQIYQLLESICWHQQRSLTGLDYLQLSYISQFYGRLHRIWQDNQQRLVVDFRPNNHDLKISLPRLNRVFQVNRLINGLIQLEDQERSSLITNQNQFWYHLYCQTDQSHLRQLAISHLQALNKHCHAIYSLGFEKPASVYNLDSRRVSLVS